MTCNSSSKFDFQKVTGYVVAHPQKLIAIGHTARVSPWSDPSFHQHASSEEYYLLLNGQLEFLVRDFQINLHPGEKILLIEDTLVAIHAREILEVPPNVSHTIYSRKAPYQGFTLRVPVELNDKIVIA
jgi:mannose-6-phosphate isomerase-like protein (cupin superfamily)